MSDIVENKEQEPKIKIEIYSDEYKEAVKDLIYGILIWL